MKIETKKQHTSLSQADHQMHEHNGWMLVFSTLLPVQAVAWILQPVMRKHHMYKKERVQDLSKFENSIIGKKKKYITYIFWETVYC